MICIKNAKIVLEDRITDGVLHIEGDRITAVGRADEPPMPDAEVIDACGAYVGPGFVDIHVHGGGDWMFHSHPEQAAAHFLAHGETTQLATLYYDLSKEDFLAAVKRVKDAMKTPAGSAIAGFYMEGPYMNPKYGASPEKNKWKGQIRAEDYLPIVEEAGELARVWAVAPEREGVADFMRDVHQRYPNARFAVGHSEAAPEQIEAVRQYGIALQTHCMDATGRTSKWLGTRGCGPDEYFLSEPELHVELICDSLGVHVAPTLQKMILLAKGYDKVALISDSFVSHEPSPQELRDVTDLSFDAGGNLSGSRLTMDAACRNIVKHVGCGMVQAFWLASRNPARAVGLTDRGVIETGKKADLVFVDENFHVKEVILNGRIR